MVSVRLFLVIYALEAIVFIYIGMRIAARQWRKRYFDVRNAAYERGFKNGQNHLNRISECRTDLESAMWILTDESSQKL